jgi:hypothetical protein
VWSDAMWERSAHKPAAGGFVVYVPPRLVPGRREPVPARVIVSSHVTPDEVVRRLVPGKKTYIGQLEIMYAGAAFSTLPHVFR